MKRRRWWRVMGGAKIVVYTGDSVEIGIGEEEVEVEAHGGMKNKTVIFSGGTVHVYSDEVAGEVAGEEAETEHEEEEVKEEVETDREGEEEAETDREDE